jgi:hypothetical protein
MHLVTSVLIFHRDVQYIILQLLLSITDYVLFPLDATLYDVNVCTKSAPPTSTHAARSININMDCT